MDTGLISVIVPVYNTKAYLEKCVCSLLSQKYANFEIVLVDDGSTDGSSQICDELAAKDARVKVLHKSNGGLSDARNYALGFIRGQYVSFVDGDDYVDDQYLSYLIDLKKVNPACKCVCGNIIKRFADSDKLYFSASSVSVYNESQAIKAILYDSGVSVCACAKLYDRDVFETVKYPVGKYFEDEYIIGEIVKVSGGMIVGPEAHYYYVQREGSIVHQELSQRKIKDQMDACSHLIELATDIGGDVQGGIRRRYCRDRLSLLRLVSPKWYKDSQVQQLRKDVLCNGFGVLLDGNACKRDKIGIVAIVPGLRVFSAVWRLFDWARARF